MPYVFLNTWFPTHRCLGFVLSTFMEKEYYIVPAKGIGAYGKQRIEGGLKKQLVL